MNNAKEFEHYSLNLKVKVIPIVAGKFISILHEDTAKKLGILPLDRAELVHWEKNKSIVTVVDTTTSIIKRDEIGIFEDVRKKLKVNEGKKLRVSGVGTPESLEFVKKKMRGGTLSEQEIKKIVEDFGENKLSEIEASAFMTSVFINGYTLNETVAMARALTENGITIKLDVEPVVDKHSIGGINGRATMLIVPIVAAGGLFIPKTSSRSITSAAGTADAMEVLANVELSAEQIKSITEKHGGVIAWGGSLDLAPVDDKIIKIERPLSMDPRGQVIASVLAKKASVGSKFVVVDIPIGPGLKVVDREEGKELAGLFIKVGRKLGMKVEAVLTDGSQPSGSAFGSALEARHVLRILEGKEFDSLAQKSCELAGVLFELVGRKKQGKGCDYAKKLLDSGQALKKFREIIKAQGKRIDKAKDVPMAPHKIEVRAKKSGEISFIDVKKMINIAKIAGAPSEKLSGVLLNVEVGQKVEAGDLLFEIFAENKRKLELAEKYALSVKAVQLEKIILERFI